MASEAPLSRLVLAATSVADLGYVALADVSRVLRTEVASSHRMIGGDMVTAGFNSASFSTVVPPELWANRGAMTPVTTQSTRGPTRLQMSGSPGYAR